MNSNEIVSTLFLDIETVPAVATFDELSPDFQALWRHKAKGILRKDEALLTAEEVVEVYERAGIYAEFGKIICISVGAVSKHKETGELQLRLKSFANDDESILLKEFSELLNNRYNYVGKHFLCGHNIKEFDIPYICRRLLINRLPLPALLDISGKKPWETKHLVDTMEMWKFGDNKATTSLKLLAAVLGFPSPKDDIDGSEVAGVYWNDQDLPRIARYCEKDVLAVVQLLLRYQLMPILEVEQIQHV
jgi:3'-5' exonuclease